MPIIAGSEVAEKTPRNIQPDFNHVKYLCCTYCMSSHELRAGGIQRRDRQWWLHFSVPKQGQTWSLLKKKVPRPHAGDWDAMEL